MFLFCAVLCCSVVSRDEQLFCSELSWAEHCRLVNYWVNHSLMNLASLWSVEFVSFYFCVLHETRSCSWLSIYRETSSSSENKSKSKSKSKSKRRWWHDKLSILNCLAWLTESSQGWCSCCVHTVSFIYAVTSVEILYFPHNRSWRVAV